MSIPLDVTNLDSVFGWLFHVIDTELVGDVGLMVFVLLALVFGLLMYFNANKFTAVAFLASVLIGLGLYGYSLVGWIAVFGLILGGLLIGVALIKILQIG